MVDYRRSEIMYEREKIIGIKKHENNKSKKEGILKKSAGTGSR
jgi:hypothetical protein